VKGKWIVVTSWVAFGVFAVTIIPDAAGLKAMDGVGVGVALGLFLVALLVWMYAFGVGVVRSARGDDVGVGNLFFLQGSAPRDVRVQLFSALGLSVVLAFATVYGNAFAALEPMFPLALISLWGARYGTFPARTDMPGSRPNARTQPKGAA
jgi:hypothetical protein